MKKEIASVLLDIGAVFLRPNEPFTWASGIKSPVYCDNRLILTSVSSRNAVENALCMLIKQEYPECELIMGTATAGIAHAAIVADKLGLPMGYVRSDNKSHGRQNKIEGRVQKGQKTLVIEDLVSTGGSVISAAEALREVGAEVIGAVCIFTYGMQKGKDELASANLKCKSLTDFDTVCEIAANRNIIAPEDIARLLRFRDNPGDESWIK